MIKKTLSIVCIFAVALTLTTGSVFAGNNSCKYNSEHFKDCKEKNSYTVGKEYKDHGKTYRVVYCTSKKWICGYADNGRRAKVSKGIPVYWSEVKDGGNVSVSFPLGYGGISFGNVSVTVPAGAPSSSSVSYPSNPAPKTGRYKVYVHRYYTIKTATTEVKYYDKKAKKWKWKKEGTRLLSKNWSQIIVELVK